MTPWRDSLSRRILPLPATRWCCVISLPVQRSALLAAVQRCLVRRGGAPPERPILVIEDDTPTREIITELLTEQGYAVATAADGAEARAQVATSLPELVILDLLLPRVSG